MKNKKTNNKVFLPIGVSFMGVGAIFMTSINPGVGLALIGVGIMFIIIGVSKKDGDDSGDIGQRDNSD